MASSAQILLTFSWHGNSRLQRPLHSRLGAEEAVTDNVWEVFYTAWFYPDTQCFLIFPKSFPKGDVGPDHCKIIYLSSSRLSEWP